MNPLRSLTRTVLLPSLVLAFALGGCTSNESVDSAGASTSAPQAQAPTLPKPTFNSDGSLNRPERYREWIYVGTPLTPNSLNPPEAPFPDFHAVYIHPEDFAEYSRSGTFPQGTVIVKELVEVGAEQAVSGKGYFMGEFIGLEATIKDAARFPDEPGNWAYFSFGHSYPLADAAEAFPAVVCNSCHQASAADDFVFTQYYPVLRAAKGGQDGEEYSAASGDTMGPGDETFDELTVTMSAAMEVVMEPNAPAATVEGSVPTDGAALFEFLMNGDYRGFAHESAMHPSRGPHTNFGLPVQVYFDRTIDASLAAANSSHPSGSSIVKEMFNADGELEGWAVMVKTQDDSDGGNGWFWYEVTNTTDGGSPVASGNGVPLCFGCHGAGNDFVLSDYP